MTKDNIMEQQRTCKKCNINKAIHLFPKLKNGYFLRTCKTCVNEYRNSWRRPLIKTDAFRKMSREWKRVNYVRQPEKWLWLGARRRAKDKGLVFTITRHDIIIPEFCPVFGTKLEKGNAQNHDNAPSIDRIVPELGYTKENIRVISNRANTIKNSGTIEEHEKILLYMKSHLIS